MLESICLGKKASLLTKLIIMIRTAWVTFTACTTVLLLSIFSKCTRDKVDKIEREWARKVLNIIKLRYRIDNPTQLQLVPGKNYIIMSNHAGHYDIPLIISALPGSIRMVAKKELFRIPIWGPALKKAEFVSINRENRKEAFKDLEVAKEKMQTGIVLWIAPEGTRTRTGKLSPFKQGGFLLALQTGAIIIPVGIRGSAKALPPDTWDFRVGEEAHITLCEPVDTSAYTTDTRKELILEVEKKIRKAIGEEIV